MNTLTTLKYDGKEPKVQIALYEYGNDSLNARQNWVRQVTPLTQDLDLISEKLFALRTNGGSEYTGAVIRDATKALNWDDSNHSMRLMYIAGNESFNQGDVDYRKSIAQARQHNIFVNTIFCGDAKEGVTLQWQHGADLGDGKYFAINSDEKVRDVVTPYDDALDKLNHKLNDTYIGYGAMGSRKKANQEMQDSNAKSMAPSVMASRAVSKSKSTVYNNSSWDLVDKVKEDSGYISKASDDELPAEVKGKSLAEKQHYIASKDAERGILQQDIAKVARERQLYIDKVRKESGAKTGDDLSKAIEASVLAIAVKSGFKQVK